MIRTIHKSNHHLWFLYKTETFARDGVFTPLQQASVTAQKRNKCVCLCVGVFFFFTLAGEALNMEVCVFDSNHLSTANLPTALAHDGRATTVGGRRGAVVVSSIKTRLVLD